MCPRWRRFARNAQAAAARYTSSLRATQIAEKRVECVASDTRDVIKTRLNSEGRAEATDDDMGVKVYVSGNSGSKEVGRTSVRWT